MKKVMIPTCKSPFNVFVNGEKYTYPSGTEQEVPDEVAIVIEQHAAYHEEKAKVESGEANQGGGGTGGGAVGNCKLKLTVDGDGETMAYGHIVLIDGKNTTVYFDSIGVGSTVEYEIPCGSAIVKTCDFGATCNNLTQIPVGGDGTVTVYVAPNEPNAVATMSVYFGWY